MNATSQQRLIGSDSKMEVDTDTYCMDELKAVSELRVKNNASDVVVNTLNNASNLHLDYGNKYRGLELGLTMKPLPILYCKL